MTTTTVQHRPGRAAHPTRLAVDVRGLTKHYGRRTAVDDLDMAIPAGSVAGFIGPNGAGKTTTLRMLLGLIRPSSEDGTVLGEPLAQPARYLSRVGALIESPAFLSGAVGTAQPRSAGGARRPPAHRVDPALRQVGLADRGGDAYRSYSLGMKQRLGIAAALLSDPQLLVLDEPTNGLDPTGIREMRELLRTIARGGPTVLVSSHLLAELEQVCDWLVVVDHGRRAYQGPADELMALGSSAVSVRPEHPAQLDRLADIAAAQQLSVRRDGDRLQLVLSADLTPEAGRTLLAQLNRIALAHDIALVEIAPHRASLEERYQGLVSGLTDHGPTHLADHHKETK